MDNAKQVQTAEWVKERLGVLEPADEWEPATATALEGFRARISAADRRPFISWRMWVLGGGLACLFLVTLPASRAAAQRWWHFITVGRVAFMRLDMDKLPDSLRLDTVRTPVLVPVRDRADAAQRAGFIPRLPNPTVLPGSPRLTVLDPVSFAVTVNTSDLERALHEVDVYDELISMAWNGARVMLGTGPVLMAEYHELMLMQALPLTIATPAGFDFRAFSEVLLRIVGLNRADAGRFAAQMAATPILLFPILPEDTVEMRQVRLKTGWGTLLHDLDDSTTEITRVTLVWSVSDRIYTLSAKATDDVVIGTANSIE